jgi:plastocyanin
VNLFLGAVAHASEGVLKGKVIFKGDVDSYKRSVLNTAKDPNCKKAKKKIGSYDVIINSKTEPMTVRNVIVSIKDGLGSQTFKAPSEPVQITQEGCEYAPHIITMMEGQGLQILNADDTNHNIHFLPKKNEELNFSQPKKDTTTGKTVQLTAEVPFKVKCDVHPWMGAYVAVFTHPFFATTDKDGTFEITGVPAGKYTVEAWHETFGTLTMEMEVASGATVEKDFTFEKN